MGSEVEGGERVHCNRVCSKISVWGVSEKLEKSEGGWSLSSDVSSSLSMVNRAAR